MNKNTMLNANVSIGGVSAIPKYLPKTSTFLKNKKISTEIITKAQVILQSEISPISDVRGTEQYKRLLAKNLFYTHFVELFPEQIHISKLITL